MTPSNAYKLIEEKLAAASGKSVLVQRDPNCAGYASNKIASDEDSAHVLRYKPELESELPYLSAFQCGLALRSIQAKTTNRFDLASTPTMGQEVKQLIEEHLRMSGSAAPMSMVTQLCRQLGHGLGLQFDDLEPKWHRNLTNHMSIRRTSYFPGLHYPLLSLISTMYCTEFSFPA